MPADRLALAVGISREDQAVGLPGLVGDRLELLRLVAIGLPFHGEALVGIDRPVLGRQVADMAVRGEDPIRSEEHTSELQSLMRISYAVFCLNKTKKHNKEL